MKRCLFLLISTSVLSTVSGQNIIQTKKSSGAFTLVSVERTAAIYVDEQDEMLVKKAAELFQSDIEKVTGKRPHLVNKVSTSSKNLVIIGSLEGSSLIKKLASQKKINVSNLRHKWEGYLVQTVSKPLPGIDQALVIAGSDRRGTAYGVFHLAEQMGVSPWYWWADVPVKKKEEVYIKANSFLSDAPRVKYRGIFINDEAPALSGWSREKFGGFNHKFYEKVFELILRLKGNYLWPAMWGNAFYDDDPRNKQTADDYGIVIGTSHHEPLMRAHDEWRRYGRGKWNYDSNEVKLRDFWKEGIQRSAGTETIISVGMRGDGDEPMTEGTAIALLERIVKDQRQLISEVSGKPAGESPQLWALYKEVQDYYDKGMRVPEDITLLLCDDNWGNIRRLPQLKEKKRKGGYGIYYHFDYVGGPRNYKWINTNNIARVWEQMHLAWEYGARQIWIVNVGDIKPMEFPVSFFLDYAWDPAKWKQENLRTYYHQWSAKQFGGEYAKEIGEIIRKYAHLSARRKPELLSPETYPLFHHNEAEYVLKDFRGLLQEAERINDLLPSGYRDAYFQLVLHPVKALTNLHELYHAVAWNRFYASQKLEEANQYAEKARQYYQKDSLITLEYHGISNGKWNHMMDQTHIGYTYWQQPPVNKMPEVKYISSSEALSPPVAIDSTVRSAEDNIPSAVKGNVFYEFDGFVSMEAANWTRAINSNGITWKVIPDIGKTGSGIHPTPVTASVQIPKGSAPHTEYDFYTYSEGDVTVQLFFSPTLNFHNTPEGLQYAVSIDGEAPQVISINKEDKNNRTWERWVANNIIIKTSKHSIAKPGKHTVKFWMVHPGVVLQKLVVDLGGARPTYLGPPETKKD